MSAEVENEYRLSERDRVLSQRIWDVIAMPTGRQKVSELTPLLKPIQKSDCAISTTATENTYLAGLCEAVVSERIAASGEQSIWKSLQRTIPRSESRDVSVIEALENPNFKWRTLGGVAGETSISIEEVREVLKRHDRKIIQCSRNAEGGAGLYTTRKHYKRSSPFWERLVSTIVNRPV